MPDEPVDDAVMPDRAAHFFSGPGLLARIVRGALGAGTAQAAGIGLTFVLHLLLARALGIEEYGLYLYAVTWAGMLSLIAKLGFDTAAARFIPVFLANGETARLHGFVRRGNIIVLFTSTALAILAAAIVYVAGSALPAETQSVFWLTCPLLPLIAVSQWLQGVLRGFQRVVRSELPERVVRPLLMMALITIVPMSGLNPGNAMSAVALHLAAMLAAVLLAAHWVRTALPGRVDTEPQYATGEWIRTSLPMAVVAISFLVMSQIDILMVGYLMGPAPAGNYGIAIRIAGLALLGLVAVNTILGPKIADLHARRRYAGLQRVMIWTGRLNFIFSATVATILVLFGIVALSLFGVTAPESYHALVILLAGYLAGSSVGSVGLLLTMAGQERVAAKILLAGIAANIALNAVLIPAWGLVGAAVATAVTTMSWRAAMAMIAWRRLSVNSFILIPCRA